MAQNATIYKVELSVSDMDRHYYDTHKLTVAKHPSETDERLMVRILAFALNAHEHLEMTKGLSTDDEPDIWQKSLTGELDVWVALGLPSEKLMRQSCGKAKNVIVYPYGGRTAEMWWDKMKTSVSRFENLQVTNFSEKDTGGMAKLASRVMKLQVNIQDGDVMVSVGDSIVYVTPLKCKRAALLTLFWRKMGLSYSVVPIMIRSGSPLPAFRNAAPRRQSLRKQSLRSAGNHRP
ncbi:MAG: YaeQ family protein [Hoeflea sp.]|nr:YaeQ family protein [Hoeflea sp.]